jgi:hypothetical protein
MKIAVLSDTHDNIWAFSRASERLAGVQAILHCGDLCSPFMIPRLAKAAPGKPVHIVWGNNDGDRRLLTVMAGQQENLTLHGDFAQLELGGLRVAINHYPEIGRALAAGGQYDLVCYGHDHTAHQEWVGQTLLLNPGELMGLNGRRSLVVLETDDRSLEWIDID